MVYIDAERLITSTTALFVRLHVHNQALCNPGGKQIESGFTNGRAQVTPRTGRDVPCSIK
jgi:hypothetical protein